MASAASYESPPFTDELCEAILNYHWSSGEDNRRSGRSYKRAVTVSDRYLEANRERLEEQDLIFLRFSHDHTSVFVTLDEHQSSWPMMKWVVCKPLGFDVAIPKARRESYPDNPYADVPRDAVGPAWGTELYDSVMKRFWFDGEKRERNSLHQQAVLISDKFWEANRGLLDDQEWVMLTKGINDLVVLVSLNDFSKEEKYLTWSPAKIEGWYGALPKEIRKPEMPWIHRIAFNDLSH